MVLAKRGDLFLLRKESKRMSATSNLKAARAEFKDLQDRFPESLGAYKLVVNGRLKARVAQCSYHKHQIELAKWIMGPYPVEEIIEAVRHECAHALAGPDAGHGPRWVDWAMRIGSNASVHSAINIRPPYKWEATCPAHGKLGGWFRQPSAGKRYHRGCGMDVTITKGR